MRVLDDLLSVDFEARAAAGANGSVRRKLLLRSPEVLRLREVRRSGALSDLGIRRFVGRLMAEFAPSQRFPYQNALSAIAVLMEGTHSVLGDEYLLDLARLDRPELTDAIEVARECLRHSCRRTKDARKRVKLDSTAIDVGHARDRLWADQPRIASRTATTTAFNGAT